MCPKPAKGHFGALRQAQRKGRLAGFNRFSPYGTATLPAYAFGLGLTCSYGHHLGVTLGGLPADLFWAAVFMFKHGDFLTEVM